MYRADHAPPHFHAVYGEHEAKLTISPASLLAGRLPPQDLVLGENPEVFANLRDPAEFANVFVHPEAGTVVWPDGPDLDPDVLYARAHSLPIPRD